ncbi:MAG: hypothetical protein FJ387_23570 [Verrucomicrobia bacterium]|nr:hypothetical protein [Verrucomicrobiota bacterium]
MAERARLSPPLSGTAVVGEGLPEQPGCVVPDHDLIRCIGRGSYGEVWLARNIMGTYRAVKIVRRSAFADQRPFERELAGIRKFEPLSRSHEGLIDVLQVGQATDRTHFYYIMELGDDHQSGRTIDPAVYVPKSLARELKRSGRLPLQTCLQLGLTLSSALDHLHGNGLVHRDIKPSNIIFVDGVPKLADIGLVTEIGEARSYVGTQGFIPPEGPGSVQADLYSLGKVLYEMSTGNDRQEYPALPTDLDAFPDVAGALELNEVIVRACQPDPRQRYPSAEELHAELILLSHGKSIKRLRLLEQRVALLTKAAVATTVAVAVLGATYLQVSRARARAAALRQREVGALVVEGTHAMAAGDFSGALPALIGALRLDAGDAAREETHRTRLAAVLDHGPKLSRVWALEGQVSNAEFGLQGQSILTSVLDGQAQIWQTDTGAARGNPFGPGELLDRATWSPNGRWVATASQNQTATVWEATTGRALQTFAHPGQVYSATFHPTQDQLLTGCEDRQAHLWDLGAGTLTRTFSGHTDAVLTAQFSPDGQWVVTCSRDKTARLWQADTGRPAGLPWPHNSWVYSATFSPDSQRVVTAGFDRAARVFEVATGRLLLPLLKHRDAVYSAEFSPDGRHLLTASWDSTARLWDAETQQPVAANPVLWHGSRVMRATFHPNGQAVLTACIDGTVRLWDLSGTAKRPAARTNLFSSDGKRFLAPSPAGFFATDTLTGERASAEVRLPWAGADVAWGAGGRHLIASSPEVLTTNVVPQLQIFDVASGQPVSPPLPHRGPLSHVVLSPDGSVCVTFEGRRAQAYRVATAQPMGPPITHDQTIAQVLLSPDRSRLVTLGTTTASVWSLATGNAVYGQLRHRYHLTHAAFSPDGRRLVTSTADDNLAPHAALVWDLATGRTIGAPLPHRDGVLHAAFSPDGTRLVTASEDFTAVLWDCESGVACFPPLLHDDHVYDAAFSPDGRWLATASRDRTARLWDARTGEPITPPLPHDDRVLRVRWLGGAQALFTTDRLGKSLVWPVSHDRRPLADLEALGDLLAGRLPSSQAVTAAWERLSALYPESFASTGN